MTVRNYTVRWTNEDGSQSTWSPYTRDEAEAVIAGGSRPGVIVWTAPYRGEDVTWIECSRCGVGLPESQMARHEEMTAYHEFIEQMEGTR